MLMFFINRYNLKIVISILNYKLLENDSMFNFDMLRTRYKKYKVLNYWTNLDVHSFVMFSVCFDFDSVCVFVCKINCAVSTY